VTGNGHTPGGRLARLETIWRASQTCPSCHGHPSRLICADPETGVEWYENMPPTGCPACGTPITGREHRIMIADDGTGTPPAMFRRSSAAEGTA
jgi:hypothetical protein